jgi:hypothetical protein
MKILLVDTHKYFKVTFNQMKIVLTSGLTPDQWTQTNILTILC